MSPSVHALYMSSSRLFSEAPAHLVSLPRDSAEKAHSVQSTVDLGFGYYTP